MNYVIPTPEEVQNHFSNAKEVKCLNLDVIVNISYVTRFDFNSKTNSYTSNGGVIVVWNDGKYAEIIKKKCGKCKECNCK